MAWFKKTSYPEYWKNYANCFKDGQTQAIEALRFVVFDTETTGLNTRKDRILSIGCVGVLNLKIKVSDQFETYLIQKRFNTETVRIHGLLKQGSELKQTEEEALKSFLNYLQNAVIVAHHAAFDVSMINQGLKRLGLPNLKNKVLDTGHINLKTKGHRHNKYVSLDELSKEFNIPQHDRHTASGDAFITALLFLKLVKSLSKNQNISLSDLMSKKERIGLL
jgi:DNA polymerase-3 subunit epsilon